MATNNDVRIMYTEDDLKKVQTKTNLYLQKFGDLGIFHLFREGAQNGIDEGEDPGCWQFFKEENEKKFVIKITHDKLSDKITIEDNGRGIPEDDYPIDIVCTKLQSGSKFYRDQGGASSGEFGVGITVVNALSSEFTLTTYRNDYYHKIGFKNGEKVLDEKEPIKKGMKKHGTIISFISNPVYLGAGSHMPMDKAKDWLDDMSYLLGHNIEFHVEEWEGLSLVKKTKMKKKPFSDLIFKYIENPKDLVVQPISFQKATRITEEVKKNVVDENGKVKTKKEKVKKDIALAFAFAYDGHMEYDVQSFCNFTPTDDGGIHVEAVEEALCRYLQQQTKDTMTDLQKQKTPILYQDIKAGMKLVVNLTTNAQVSFMGNAKSKIQNETLKPMIKDMATLIMADGFANNQAALQSVIKTIKANAKARIELQKVKAVNVSKKIDTFAEYELSNFIKCNNSGNKYKELFLIEGRKSAAGSMVNARDAATQAIFGFRGVTANAFKKSLPEIMQNNEWKQYVRVLHTGIGNNFDIRRLYYDKIIISTDADIDGLTNP